MKLLLVPAAVLSLIFAGCGKKTQPPAAPAAEQKSTAEASAQPAETAPAAAPQSTAPAPEPANTPQPINGVVDPQLTTQLRIFIQERGRLPENFRELANARLDSVPRLGPGLMFAIDPATQEVKITAKR
jgi:hypothetical protein